MSGFRFWASSQDVPLSLDPSRGFAALSFVDNHNLLTRGAAPLTCPIPLNVLTIDKLGHVQDIRVTLAIHGTIERGPMATAHGIIVHQTGGSTAAGALASYKNAGANGAHFLIDKDGTIYQTASVKKRCNHVGNLKSRCMAEARCTPADLLGLKGKRIGQPIGRVEAAKSWPDRYPGNSDSVGIEIVGEALPRNEPDPDKRTYEALTAEQQISFSWLLRALTTQLGVPMTEVFRHPTVSWKNTTEGSSATW